MDCFTRGHTECNLVRRITNDVCKKSTTMFRIKAYCTVFKTKKRRVCRVIMLQMSKVNQSYLSEIKQPRTGNKSCS